MSRHGRTIWRGASTRFHLKVMIPMMTDLDILYIVGDNWSHLSDRWYLDVSRSGDGAGELTEDKRL